MELGVLNGAKCALVIHSGLVMDDPPLPLRSFSCVQPGDVTLLGAPRF